MKKYLIIFSVLAIVGCNDSQTKEQEALEAANKENMIRQRTIDSMQIINLEAKQNIVNSTSETHNTASTSKEPASKKGMSNKTKGALIGTGVGIVAGAVTGAVVSDDKGKGAVVGGIIGGAAGSGVGYGAGAQKDSKKAKKE